MTRIYISGGMTGLPDLNFPAFHKAAAELRAKGFEVVSPAELDAGDEEELTYEQYLRRDIKALMDCDVIALLTGWEKSNGANLEHDIACRLGMKRMFLE